MAIVIKEIILSDTIEKFMEKVNFNFDQLMLAGGGPIGPQGNIGPIGPIGPEGDPGNKWYVGCTGTTAAIGASLYMGDLFLQKGNCIGATYPLGEVLEFNEVTQIFVSTGLNLRGPTGEQGATGTSTGWGVYPGSDSGPGTVYNGTLNEGTPGPTASFVLMKGDAVGVTGDAEHPFYSKDSLYLGGLQGMANQVQVYQKERLPKLFVSPKTILDASVFGSNTGTTGAGLAGSGISFIREPLKNGNLYSPINQYSYSNIFIDDEMNLNITNFSDYPQAITLDSSVTNDINLMSKIGVKLLGGHYQPTEANGLLEVSESLETPLYPDQSGFFPSGGPGFHLRSTGNLNTGTISLKGTNQLRIISERISSNGNLVDVAYWANVTSLSPNNKYRIGIGANAKYRDIDDQISDMPFIGSGAFDGSAVEYIGLGNKPTGNKAPTLSTFNYSTKDFVLIGNPNNYNPSNSIGALVDKSIDIEGQIRMRYGASSPGQVLITSDSIGTAEWSPATSLGGWSNDSNCTTKIIISTNNQRFASFIPGTNINYTRVDIPSLSEIGETDMYFGAYSMTDGMEIEQQGHIINKRYQDPHNNGVLSISTGLLKNCPTGITSRQMQPASTVTPRLQIGAYGEIVIGNLAKTDDSNLSELGVINNVAGAGGINALATGLLIDTFKIYKSRTTTQTGSIPAYHKFSRANIHLINNNVGDDPVESGDLINPLIKFTPNDTTPNGNLLSGDEWGFDSTTSFEVLRTYGTDNAGPGNIRFLGVGKSTKTNNPDNAGIGNAAPSDETTGRGQERQVGSHVMMISDVTAKNKYNEVGKAYDYYEVNDLGINIDSISASFFNYAASKGTRRFVYNKFDLNPWGTAASGWNNLNGQYGRFQGGRSSVLTDSFMPENYQIDDSVNTFNGNQGSGPWEIPGTNNKAKFLNAWISPSAGVRFSPMNLSTPSTDAQTGLAWIDFNIDMGLIMEASNSSLSDYLYGYYGVVRSLGGNIDTPYDPVDIVYQGDKMRALSKSFKVKHIKIQLNSNELGITSFLDNLDYSTRRDPLTGTNFIYENDPDSYQDIRNNSEQISKGIFYTDWYVGQVKAMNNLTGKGLSTNNPFDESGQTLPEGGRDTETSGALPWSQLTDNNGVLFPFKDDPSNPIAGLVPNMNFNTLGTDVKWKGHESSSFANSNKNATFMWRIYTQYSPNSFSNPFGCVLELYIVPSTSNKSLNNQTGGFFIADQSWETIAEYNDSPQGHATSFKYGYEQSQGGFYPNVPLMLSQYNQTAMGGGGELNLEALLTHAMRTPEFYASHGFSLSGQSIVKWNKAKNQW